VTLETDETGLVGLGDELLLHLLRGKAHRGVHLRPAGLVRHRAAEEVRVLVEQAVDQSRLRVVHLFHGLDAALLLHVIQDELHHEDGEDGGRVEQGVLLKPVYLVANKRPVYTKEMVLRNLRVKFENVGINKKIVMFYSSRPTMKLTTPLKTTKKPTQKPVKSSNKHSDLIDDLEALGLENINTQKVESAIQKCFPTGTENISEDEILRDVFRYIKRQNSEHKQ